MKIVFSLLAFVISLPAAFAQNLVPNPSFEEYLDCPEFFDSAIPFHDWVANWTVPTWGTPDYFNECSIIEPINSGVDVPSNCIGYQLAHTGQGYAGFSTRGSCINDPNGTEYREYLQVELENPLITDSLYTISFFVSVADSCSCYTNNIGLCFTNAPIMSETNVSLDLIPVMNNQQDLLSSTSQWVEISTSYVADGTENFLVVGNFNNDINSPVEYRLDLAYDWSYIFIDDVSVVMNSSVNVQNLWNPEDNLLEVFCSHSNTIVIKADKELESIQIFQSNGKIVYEMSQIQNADLELQLALSSGLYIVLVKNEDEKLISKKFTIHK